MIGQNRQMIVFIQHGGEWYKVPNCRVQRAGQEIIEDDQSNLLDDGVAADGESVVAANGNLAALSGTSDSDSEVIVETIACDRSNSGDNVGGSVMNQGNVVCNPDLTEETESGVDSGSVSVSNVGEGMKNILPKKGQSINYRLENDDVWRHAVVTGRAGKASGGNKDWLNLKEGSSEYSVDTKRLRDMHIEEQVNVVMIPRREHNKPEIIKAKLKELNTWTELKVFDEVPDVGQPRIGTCWVITPKVINGVDSFKARLVCRGDQEEVSVPTDSPTCSKSGLRIFLSVAVGYGFTISSKDVYSAFLQGKTINRDVFLIPPDESKKPGTLWKLNKAAYGLSDAARNWYESVVEEMLRLGCGKSRYEKALYYYKQNSVIQGLSVTHVDDFLDAGNEKFKSNILKHVSQSFIIGSEAESEFEYIGVNLEQTDCGVKMDQLPYCRSVQSYEISGERKLQRNEPLTKEEMKGYRKIVGCLNWVATVSRPDLAFEVVSLSTHFRNAKVEQLLAANKAVRKLQAHDVVIFFPRLKIDHNLRVVLYTDSAYKNLCDGISSCAGYIVFLVDSENRCCVLEWKSNKIQRIVNSTLAAEALALESGIKDAIYQKTILRELFEHLPLDIQCFVDNKGVVDAVHSTRAVDDKLTRISIAIVQEHLEKKEIVEVNHIPGVDMIADPLTKQGASTNLLLEVLKSGVIPPNSLRK